MGTITSVVAELREAPGKAENFKWKEFKAYEGGVLVVRSNRLHKVAAHSRCTGLCATPYMPGARPATEGTGRPHRGLCVAQSPELEPT